MTTRAVRAAESAAVTAHTAGTSEPSDREPEREREETLPIDSHDDGITPRTGWNFKRASGVRVMVAAR